MSERDTRAHRSADRSRSAKSRRRGTDEADDHRPREKTSSKARESKRSTDAGREADSGSGREADSGRKADSGSARKADSGSARKADSGSGRKADSGSGIGPRRAAAAAAAYVQEMTGRPPEGLTALERTEDGWRIGVEALESKRIPDSTDILAVYQVDLDQDGELVSYHRERRYHRGRVEGEGQ